MPLEVSEIKGVPLLPARELSSWPAPVPTLMSTLEHVEVFHNTFVELQSGGAHWAGWVDDFKVWLADAIWVLVGVVTDCTKEHPTMIKEHESPVLPRGHILR